MNKFLPIILSLLVSSIFFNIPAKAENNLNILSSSGTASIYAEPDTAIFSFAIETENKFLTQALQENTNKAQKVMFEIKKLIGKDDSIKTTGFNVNPIYNYDNKERKSILSGYRVTNRISVKTKKLSDAGKIIDTAIKNGANKADDLDFMIENKEKYSSKLLKTASEQAKQKAYATAEALGLCIKGINRVSTMFSDETISPYYRGTFSSMEMKGSSDGATPPIEAGEVKLNATVSVDFIIENLK
ncbi:MAG TPA: hypothetical protein DDW90_00720 [Cyanobacteria bacterium UBA9971]|nr:hypothetical protein [Cyanobacteria bacterium UBA9971]